MRYVFLLSLLAACGNSLRDDRFPTGSSTVVTNRSHDVVYNVNVDEGTLSRTDLVTNEVTEVVVGADPTRVARVGDELWVTLKGERGIAVVTDDDGAMKVAEHLPAGVEPHGIVATEDGRRVYVAATLDDSVVEYDGRTREKLRVFAVQDQPRFLALHPNGNVLFVASTKDGTLVWIDLRNGETHEMEIPHTSRDTVDGTVELDPRITGDLAVLSDGTAVGVPILYADTDTSVDDPEDPEDPQPTDGYGSSVGLGVARINPALVTFVLDGEGRPVEQGDAIFLAIQPFAETDFSGAIPVYRSYPTSVTSSPSSGEWLVTMEASNAVIMVSANSRDDSMSTMPMTDVGTSTGGCEDCAIFTSPQQAGFELRSMAAISTAVGPKGVVFDGEDRALVHSWLDRSIESVPYVTARESVAAQDSGDFKDNLTMARGYVRVADSALPPDIEAGRRLFFSALDGRMAASGAGVSCSTCHMDGRNDGFTWTLKGEERNTPSLAGPVFKTAPVTWSEEVDSVATEAMLTSETRMGGNGLSQTDADLIEAYVNSTPYPDVPRAGSKDARVRNGQAIFEREDVACASCHGGELYTDNELHLILGTKATQTPTLRGIAASGPYFHDGSAANLAAVVEMATNGQMGDTSMLSSEEKADLVLYLESL